MPSAVRTRAAHAQPPLQRGAWPGYGALPSHGGAAFGGLVAGCSAADLQAGGGRVERFAQIGIRHPDDHRAELEAALGI